MKNNINNSYNKQQIKKKGSSYMDNNDLNRETFGEEVPKFEFSSDGSFDPRSSGYSNQNNSEINYEIKPKNKKTGAGKKAALIIVTAVLSAAIGAGGCFAALFATGNIGKKNSQVTTPSGGTVSNVNINIDETAQTVEQAVAEKVKNSVVGIRTTTAVSSFFGGESESTGEGSGVVYSSDGYIITNYHVIQSAVESKGKIEVYVGSLDSQSYNASVIGYNISYDLAVIKIDATGLSAVEIGDSSALKVGQTVITVGNPGGLEFMGSVTSGIISGLNRKVSSTSAVSLIQTDAAINPGNSGGALLNIKGQLVGINSSKIVSEEYEGMGFAIPVNDVVEKCNKIISKENSAQSYIGVSISTKYTSSVLSYYGYPSGAVVSNVDENGPADKAGIKRGDIITEFNGSKITEYSQLTDLIKETDAGEKVKVKYYRSGKTHTATVTVGSDASK